MKNKIKDLKAAVAAEDNEAVHIIYDEILWDIAFRIEPTLLAELDVITKDSKFWYS